MPFRANFGGGRPRSDTMLWYGIYHFTGGAIFQGAPFGDPNAGVYQAGLPTGSANMTIGFSARWHGPPASGSGGNPLLFRYGNASNRGWTIQELPVSKRIGFIINNLTLVISHSMIPSSSYNFAITLQNGTASMYANGLPWISGASTYSSPLSGTDIWTFGGSTSNLVPARNWSLAAWSMAGDRAMSATEVSSWNATIIAAGQPLPVLSASHYWNARDLFYSGATRNIVASQSWIDRNARTSISGLYNPVNNQPSMEIDTFVPTFEFVSWSAT
jgi:hypothetical protein